MNTADLFFLILLPTKYLKNVTFYHFFSLKKLPLHVAINSGAPKDVIEVLLNACKRRQTYLEKTSEGRLPLHIAIEKMADKEVIELLLKADIEQESMYEEFKGMVSRVVE